jgi:hypothetical protein
MLPLIFKCKLVAMKKILQLLILLYLLISSGLQAQNFQTVNSGRVAYFTTYGEDFQFLRIDSARFNGDSVFYPNRCIDLISGENDYPRCYSPYQSSWAGSMIIVRDEGANIYFNRENDSIVIKTRAKLNDIWKAYQKEDSILITAEVIAYDTAIVLGLVDSIKTIQFQVFDSTGAKLNHPYNNLTVTISKNFGWVKSLNFNYFPNVPDEDYRMQYASFTLVGMDNPKLGVQNLTWFEVFDFQPGDVLHVKKSSIQCGVSNGEFKITDIKYTYLKRTDYADSIIYWIDQEQQETNRINGEKIVSFKHDTIKSVIHSDSEFNILSSEPIIDEGGYSLRMNVQYWSNTKYVYQLPMHKDEDHCWRLLMFDGGGGSYFLRGLGGDYYEYSGISGCDTYDNILVYYKKGNITWGTPFDFTDIEVFENMKQINVFPNPASNKICIETNGCDEPITLELYSSGGSLIFHQIIHSEKQDVDVTHLENGIYFYKVSTSDQILKNGKITILH